jgi:hypothetical protein
MAEILIHAGMPKAGSTSIERWIQAESSMLQERGVTVTVARRGKRGEIVFVPYDTGSVNSSWVVHAAAEQSATEQVATATALADGLAAAAERYGNIVVTGESLSKLFSTLHEPSLRGLQRLSASHAVRIAYYVRPQHTSLEAMWRQNGYREKAPPSVFVENQAGDLRYAATHRGVNSLAPGVDFAPRPLRRDLLHSGDLVGDFAAHFLGIEVSEPTKWMNRGLPLELVNVLRVAPDGMFWDTSNSSVRRLKRLLADHRSPEDEEIALSRRVLGKYAHERFAAENAELGWDDFVPPLEDDEADEVPGIEALDRLWEPKASPAELALLFRVLNAAIEGAPP